MQTTKTCIYPIIISLITQPEGVLAGVVREGEGYREEDIQGAPQARRPQRAGRQGALHQERQGPQDLRGGLLPCQGQLLLTMIQTF